MQLFKKLFQGMGGKGNSPQNADPNGIIYYVKGRKCGAITRVRIDRNNELSRSDDGDGFVLHKVIVDSKCFGKTEITITYDGNYREVERQIVDGEFVTHEAWVAASQSQP